MRSKIAFLFVALLLCLNVSASQQIITSKSMADFSTIELKGNLTVELIAADTNKIELELFDCDITKIKWVVENQILKVSLRSSASDVNARVEVKIYYNKLRKIDISSGQLKSKGIIDVEMLDVTASSGAIVNLQVQCLDLEVDVVQNSVVQIEGTTRYLTVAAQDKSKVDMRSLSSVSVNADASSSAEIYVLAMQRLVANAKTGGSVFYKGEPRLIRASTPKVVKLGSDVRNIIE